MNKESAFFTFLFGFLLLAALVVAVFFTATVSTGSVGVITNFGKVTGSVLDSGWHIVGPVDHVTEISIRTITTQTEASCFSRDLQAVNITLAVQTCITKENATMIYKNYGAEYMSQASPKILDALKAETAKYDAAEIIANREKIRNEALKAAQSRLAGFVEVQDLSIVNVAFSKEYEKAIEARGEAQAIQIRGEALAKNPTVIELELITKWDGKAPETLVTNGGSGASSIILPVSRSK